jgi:hypothetical protein
MVFGAPRLLCRCWSFRLCETSSASPNDFQASVITVNNDGGAIWSSEGIALGGMDAMREAIAKSLQREININSRITNRPQGTVPDLQTIFSGSNQRGRRKGRHRGDCDAVKLLGACRLRHRRRGHRKDNRQPKDFRTKAQFL